MAVPPAYPLPFYNHSVLSEPLYHFRSDWTTAGNDINFTKAYGGGPAQVGDRVGRWKNAYQRYGHARVPNPCPTSIQAGITGEVDPITGLQTMQLPCDGGNWFGIDGYPTLVSRSYPESGFRDEYVGLQFTGSEYLQILGSSLKNGHGITAPLFTTGGSTTMTKPYRNTGASFLFVVDLDRAIPGIDGGPYSNTPVPGFDAGWASNWEIMLFSKAPGMTGEHTVPICGPCPPGCAIGWTHEHSPYFHPPYTATSMLWTDQNPCITLPNPPVPNCGDLYWFDPAQDGWYDRVRDVQYTWPETETMGVQFSRHYRGIFRVTGSTAGATESGNQWCWGPVGNRLDSLNTMEDPVLNTYPKGWRGVADCNLDGTNDVPPCWVQGGPNAPTTSEGAFGNMMNGWLFRGYWEPPQNPMCPQCGPPWDLGNWHSFTPSGHDWPGTPPSTGLGNRCDGTSFPGPQVILIEYDNTDIEVWKCGDGTGPGSNTQGFQDGCDSNNIHRLQYQNYTGPTFKIYGIGNTLPKDNPVSTGCGFPGTLEGVRWGPNLADEMIVLDHPAVADHILFDSKNLFLGGIPPLRCERVDPAFGAYVPEQGDFWRDKFGNGMRGVLYEFMMFEGKLDILDKMLLGNALKQKYKFLS